MGTRPKRDVFSHRVAFDLEDVGGREHGLVPVRGTEADHHVLAFVERLATERRVGEASSDEKLRRRIDAERFFDHRVDQASVGAQALVELGLLCESVERAPDQVARGLGSGADHEQDLHPDRARREAHSLDLGGQESSQGILRPFRFRRGQSLGNPVVDVLRELRNGFRHRDGSPVGCRGGECGADLVRPCVVLRGVLGGETDQPCHRVRRYGIDDDLHDVETLTARGRCRGRVLVDETLRERDEERFDLLRLVERDDRVDDSPDLPVTRLQDPGDRRVVLVESGGAGAPTEREDLAEHRLHRCRARRQSTVLARRAQRPGIRVEARRAPAMRTCGVGVEVRRTFRSRSGAGRVHGREVRIELRRTVNDATDGQEIAFESLAVVRTEADVAPRASTHGRHHRQ